VTTTHPRAQDILHAGDEVGRAQRVDALDVVPRAVGQLEPGALRVRGLDGRRPPQGRNRRADRGRDGRRVRRRLKQRHGGTRVLFVDGDPQFDDGVNQ